MNPKMQKMMSKKKDLSSDAEKEAKMSVVNHLREMAQSAMGDNMSKAKKVSVLSDSTEGLKSGLDKAKSMLSSGGEYKPDSDEASMEHMKSAMESDPNQADEAAEEVEEDRKKSEEGSPTENDDAATSHMESVPEGDLEDPENLDKMIEHLQEKKRMLQASQK